MPRFSLTRRNGKAPIASRIDGDSRGRFPGRAEYEPFWQTVGGLPSRDADQTRRLPALAWVSGGSSRNGAEKLGGVGLKIACGWVLHFNASGPDGPITSFISSGQTGRPYPRFNRQELSLTQDSPLFMMLYRSPVIRSSRSWPQHDVRFAEGSAWCRPIRLK